MKIGSLFSGVAGLDRAVEAVTGATPAWFVEFDAAPSKVLERHYPGVPNYGDVTTVDWSSVEPVDILTGGFPCQDLSHAGKRRGLRPGTRSGLWEHMAYAINELHPRLVVIENVRGLLSADAHSDVEPCPWCLGGESEGYLRALGAVLADLADIGYDARWCGVRASDAGAPHRRFRVFAAASPGDTQSAGPRRYDLQGSGLREPGGGRGPTTTPDSDSGQFARTTHRLDGLPVASERALLPTPRATDGTKGGPNQRGSSGDLMLPSAVQPANLLPTPQARDHKDAKLQESNHRPGDTDSVPRAIFHTTADFGQYAPAIARWEAILGEPAPPPTIQGRNGPRLNPDLPRWMMGFPPGWLDGLTPAQQLKAAGNAVCPQQAELALRILLGDS